MPRWRQQIEGLLYDGEVIHERIVVETARVVVTSHRVIAFTPARSGATFQQADRPNVVGVETTNAGGWSWLRRALGAAVLGGFFLVVGLLVDFDSLIAHPEVGEDGVEQVGGGGILDSMETILGLIAQLDLLMPVVGVAWLVMAAALTRLYWTRERDPVVVIRVAGDASDITVPRPEDVESARAQLERALLSDPATATRHRTGPNREDDLLGGSELREEADDVSPDAGAAVDPVETDDESSAGVWPGE